MGVKVSFKFSIANLHSWHIMTVSDLLEHYLATSLTISTSLLQVVNSLFQTCWQLAGTCIKISHLVASLLTSRQQVVFALLVPTCQQVWNKLLTTCNNLVDIIRLVAMLFQQVRCSLDITILSQPCVVNLVTFLLYHDCIRLVRTTL
jgi:hypothetical protein